MIKKSHIWGAAITIVFGSMLHFVYGWSDENKVVALIGAVNESTWEHLKLAFWPAFIFMIWEFFKYGRGQKNFWLAKCVGVLSMPVLIILLFYGYLLFIEDNFVLDILTFIISVILGYWLSYKIMISKNDYSGWSSLTIIFVAITLVIFSLFTYYPPHIFLFQDPVDYFYGIR